MRASTLKLQFIRHLLALPPTGPRSASRIALVAEVDVMPIALEFLTARLRWLSHMLWHDADRPLLRAALRQELVTTLEHTRRGAVPLAPSASLRPPTWLHHLVADAEFMGLGLSWGRHVTEWRTHPEVDFCTRWQKLVWHLAAHPSSKSDRRWNE